VSEALEQVVSKAVADESFRNLLLSDPTKALAGYAVTAEERTLLEGLTADTFTAFAGKLGDRQTQGRWVPGTG
jgi:hypothetical protein